MSVGTTTVKFLDTRFLTSNKNTVFCDSDEHDAILARHFWLSVKLQPYIESCLVSNDIKQRLITTESKEYKLKRRHTDSDLLEKEQQQKADFNERIKILENLNEEKFLEEFNERKKKQRELFLAQKCHRLDLQKKSGQTFCLHKRKSHENEDKSMEKREIDNSQDFRKNINEFEKKQLFHKKFYSFKMSQRFVDRHYSFNRKIAEEEYQKLTTHSITFS
ncbi:protein Hoatz homolog [Octopus sinensis]|uniref:Cilia- and flagella-associated protein HOATZ n=1 Tax=Octopus sinensis TaxID=2607531 RepID=A0A6P7SCT7_9MOLL|nr:protein Hoatz homolog [Octopus sinensis]